MRQPTTQSKPAPTRAATAVWVPWVMLGTICALVIGFYAWSARPGWLGMRTARAEDAYYNLMVRGFRAGQLDLKAEVPPGLAQLADPYDPVANADYLLVDGHPLWDLSYYRGKLYLYYGVPPALVLFWPYAALTGHYLGHKDAVVVFCAIGFLASVGLLCLVWRRYFPEIGPVVVAAGTLALGLAVFTPIILPRAEVYEVAISCGYALTMLALLALWEACHRPLERGRWLAAASLVYGLAIGARPNLLFGAVILLLPVALAWREGSPRGAGSGFPFHVSRFTSHRIWVLLLAATGPITCVGLGLMLYNALRFDSPLEFGQPYMLSSVRLVTQHLWSHRFFGFNSWVYFLAPARWSAHFPFVYDITLPPLPPGYGSNEHPFGVLTSIPLVWLSLAAPLAWRGRPENVGRLLRGFLAAVALLIATRALVLGLFFNANLRYEVDFCPALVLLAAVGILGLERALAVRPAWRRAARWAWGLLLAFSLAFNLLASAIYHAEYQSRLGSLLLERGQVNEAIAHFQKALVLQPDDAGDHNNLGSALFKIGQVDEAIGHYQEALRLEPDYALVHYNFGVALVQKGQIDEAIGQYQEALRLEPDHADAHNNLGEALDEKGQTDEAIRQYQEALRLKPDHADAHNNLGAALDEKGQTDEAIRQYQAALRLKPGHAEAHNNLGLALGRKSQTDEAIRHYQEALRLKPNYADAHYNLGVACFQQGRTTEAIQQFQEALRLKPDHADARRNLEAALAAHSSPPPPPGTATNR
jgi:tetratricopeptide (TPR) repeat protein